MRQLKFSLLVPYETAASDKNFKKAIKLRPKSAEVAQKSKKKLGVTGVNRNILIWPGKRGYVFLA